MPSIEMKGFDPDKLKELAKAQTAIYNAAVTKLPEGFPAKVEDTIARFKKDTFDKSRMFYAYEDNRMVGYVGLTGRDQKLNERGMGYPWLAKGADHSVRDTLYAAAEKKCREEGIGRLRCFSTENFPDQTEFFKSKGFRVAIEFLRYEKKLTKNDFQMPPGYTIRILRREDLQTIEEVSKKDPKMKSPFVVSDYAQYMNSSNYDPETAIVAEKGGKIVGFYTTYIPPDPTANRAYFGGATVHGDHQDIEKFLLHEIENRALEKSKVVMDVTFYPDSPRLELAQELGYKQYSHSYRLEKDL